MQEQQTCSKCGGEMEKGKIHGGYGIVWIKEGKKTIFGAPTIENSYSCLDCGFVELYVNRKK